MIREVYYKIVFDKVTETLIKYFEVPEDAVKLKAHFEHDLDFSPMRFVELTVQLEMIFEKELFDNDALQIKTIEQVVDHITLKMGAPTLGR